MLRTGEALQPLMCPRCTAPMAAGDSACRRCGQQVVQIADGRLVAKGTVCPRCNRSVQPGQAYVTATGASVAGTCPHCGSPLESAPPNETAVFYEEKAESCPPFDLERISRAEAVDGWALMDTTVDPARPGRILAHFRRPARDVPPEVIRAAAERQAAVRAAAAAAFAPAPPAGSPPPPAIARTAGAETPITRASPVGTGAAAAASTSAAGPSATRPGTGPSARPDATPPAQTAQGTPLPWTLPFEVAAAAAGPLLANWRGGQLKTVGDLVAALISLAMATGVYAVVFALALATVILVRVFRSAGFLALVLVLPALLAVAAGVLRAMSGGGRSRRQGRQARRATRRGRDRHGVAWHRP